MPSRPAWAWRRASAPALSASTSEQESTNKHVSLQTWAVADLGACLGLLRAAYRSQLACMQLPASTRTWLLLL